MNARKILVVSHIPLFPINAGNRARMFAMFEALRAEGDVLHFVHVRRGDDRDYCAMNEYFEGRLTEIPFVATSRPRLLSRWQRLHRAFAPERYRYNRFVEDFYDRSVDDQIGQIARTVEPDVVLVEYVMMTSALRAIDPAVLKVVDTHDVFADRYKRFLQAGLQPNWFSAFARDEIAHLNLADRVLAIQPSEADYLRRALGNKVFHVGHLAPVRPIAAAGPGNQTVLFVGGRNRFNLDAMQWFLEACWPLVLARRPHVELAIAGEIGGLIDPAPQVRKLGPQADLTDAYRLGDVVINPCRSGTGLKVKNIEALAAGKVVLTTPHGAVGLDEAVGGGVHVADGAARFAKSLLDLLADAELRRASIDLGLTFSRQFHRRQVLALGQAFRGGDSLAA